MQGLVKGAATFLATGDHAIECADPFAGKINAMILQGGTDAQPFASAMFALPPLLEGSLGAEVTESEENAAGQSEGSFHSGGAAAGCGELHPPLLGHLPRT